MPVRERKGDDAMKEDRLDTDDRAGAAMHTDLLPVLEEVVADHDGIADAQPWLAKVNRFRDDTDARELDDPVVLAVAAHSRRLSRRRAGCEAPEGEQEREEAQRKVLRHLDPPFSS
jgi:hypothetical protein